MANARQLESIMTQINPQTIDDGRIEFGLLGAARTYQTTVPTLNFAITFIRMLEPHNEGAKDQPSLRVASSVIDARQWVHCSISYLCRDGAR